MRGVVNGKRGFRVDLEDIFVGFSAKRFQILEEYYSDGLEIITLYCSFLQFSSGMPDAPGD